MMGCRVLRSLSPIRMRRNESMEYFLDSSFIDSGK